MKLSRQLKRARVPTSDLVRFYTCCIKSVCNYTLPVVHSPLPNYLINDLERGQKRALSIICPHLSYNESLTFLDMDSLFDHHSFLCTLLFGKILDDKGHRLHHLLPPRHTPKYNFRQSRMFDLSYKTNRTKNSFINSWFLHLISLDLPLLVFCFFFLLFSDSQRDICQPQCFFSCGNCRFD